MSMLRALYVFGMGLLALAVAFLLDVYGPSEAHAAGWTGCYVGGLGSYNAGVVEDTYGAEGPGIAATIGCDAQSDRFVFGGWAEYGWKTFDWHSTDIDVEGWAAGGRAGYLVTPQALLYALLGYTDLEASTPFGSVDLTGVVVGGGSEFNLGQGFFARAEYQYLMLEPDDMDIEANVHSVRAGLVYKFNVPEVTAPFESKPLK